MLSRYKNQRDVSKIGCKFDHRVKTRVDGRIDIFFINNDFFLIAKF
jgi:hypothetical protein